VRPPFDLRVGQFSDTLRALFHAENCQSAAFLTAFNPLGVKNDDKSNALAQGKLELELKASGIRFFKAIGLDPAPDSGWQAEDSVFALNLSLKESLRIGSNFRQKAIVWCAIDAIPRLKLIDP
jgi:hypothetical protein